MKTAAPILIALALTIVGCGTATTKNEPDQAASTGTGTPAATAEKPAATATPKPRKARIGDSITLAGSNGQKIRVKLLRLIDPLTPGEYETPASGKRYVGVEVQLTNLGTGTYKDSPGNGATLIYGSDRQADMTIIVSGDCTSEFASDARIAPGAKRTGCIPFEISATRKAKMFQFALDSGFADEGGEWLLK